MVKNSNIWQKKIYLFGFLRFFCLRKCNFLSFAKWEDKSLTRVLKSTPFQNPMGAAGAGQDSFFFLQFWMVNRIPCLWKSGGRKLRKTWGGPIRNRPCILGGPIWNRLWVLGRPIRSRLCILGGPIRKHIRNRLSIWAGMAAPQNFPWFCPWEVPRSRFPFSFT